MEFQDIPTWLDYVKSGVIHGKPLGAAFKQACLEMLAVELRPQGIIELEALEAKNGL